MAHAGTTTPSGFAHVVLDERGRGWIEGTGTKVIQVVLDHIGPDRMSPEQIRLQHPHLTLDQVRAALDYYVANRAAVDEELRRADEQYRELRAKTEDKDKQERLRELKRQRPASDTGSG
jgi:uncharacterized protein (DUF433 family)